MSSVQDDETGPELLEFVSLDLVGKTIVLKFDEPINNFTFNTSNIVIQKLFENAGQFHRLINTEVTETDFTTVTLNLSNSDVFAIQEASKLCTHRSNCYVKILNDTVDDLFENSNQETKEGFPGFIVTTLLQDDSPPSIEEFQLDLDNGLLELTFSEPMKTSDILFTGFTIQSKESVSDANDFYTLTGGATDTSDGKRIVELQLIVADLNQIKLQSFATNTSNTYLSVAGGSANDMAGNPLEEIASTLGKMAYNVIDDVTEPTLEEFEIDIDEGTILLSFNEPVMLSTINFTAITLLSSDTLPNFNFTLQPGSVVKGSTDLSIMVTLELHDDDLANIKLTEDFVTNPTNTFILIEKDGVFDASSIGINKTGPFKADGFIADVTRPQLKNFSIDIEPGIIKFTFDDVVDASTFDASAFTFQSNMTSITNETVDLSPSTKTSSNNGYVITGILGLQDRIKLRDNRKVATRLNNTYLTMQAYAIDDIMKIDVLAITDGKAVLPGQFIPDRKPTRPQLVYS